MKNTYSIQERNRIVEEHLGCIEQVIRRNHSLMRAAHLDYDDVYQQLSLRLIRAVAGYDPEKGRLRQHILAQLQFELQNCKRPYRLYGMTYLPADYGRDNIVPYDTVSEEGALYEWAAAA